MVHCCCFQNMVSNTRLTPCCPFAEVQKRAAGALQDGRDIMIQSQTGSGKTLAFLLPLLSALQYPPDLYPEDLKVQSNQHV